MLHHFGLPDLEKFRFRFDLSAGTGTSRVTNGDRPGVVVCHGPEHVDKVIFVFWLHMQPIRDVTQIADVEQAVMGRAIVAAQPGPVHAQRDV